MIDAKRIKEHIIRHLQWDSSLKGSRIKVDYVARTAILSGTVPSLSAHAAAQKDAQSIPGVDRVENRLTVGFEHNHPNKNDEEIKRDVLAVLGCTFSTARDKIQVSVADGIVTLEGTTDSYWKKIRIEDLVTSVEGILEVKNRITVTPAEKVPDETIQREIIAALSRMAVEGLENISVKVKNGKVILTGSVPTWSTSFDIEDTARYTSGVTGVVNNLSVD